MAGIRQVRLQQTPEIRPMIEMDQMAKLMVDNVFQQPIGQTGCPAVNRDRSPIAAAAPAAFLAPDNHPDRLLSRESLDQSGDLAPGRFPFRSFLRGRQVRQGDQVLHSLAFAFDPVSLAADELLNLGQGATQRATHFHPLIGVNDQREGPPA